MHEESVYCLIDCFVCFDERERGKGSEVAVDVESGALNNCFSSCYLLSRTFVDIYAFTFLLLLLSRNRYRQRGVCRHSPRIQRGAVRWRRRRSRRAYISPANASAFSKSSKQLQSSGVRKKMLFKQSWRSEREQDA